MAVHFDHPLEKLLATFRATEPLGRQGRSFEQLMRWWLLNDPEFKARYSAVSKPTERDIGVDLHASPRSGGKPTAVQCKQWTGSIPKSEIDSFLSAAATNKYADSLLIHTGTGFSANAEATIASQRSPCLVVELDRLLRSDVCWPTSIDALDTGYTKPPQQPGPHQQDALEKIRYALRPGRSRTWVSMACGAGKTLVGTMVADEFAPELAVVFLPTTTALHNTVRAWRRDARTGFEELRICSQHDSNEPELWGLSHADENTTDAATIAEFLRGTGRRVVFCTYASAGRLVEAVRETSVTIDLIVADDAHNIVSRRSSTAAKSVLDDDRLPARYRLFMTATPRVWDSRALQLAERRGAPLVSMRDSANGDFGVRAYHLTHREAVERGIVLPFEVHVVQITTDEVNRVVTSGRLVATQDHSRAVLASLAATQIAVVKAAIDLGLRRIVAFHSGVAESKLFASSFAASAALVNHESEGFTLAARHADSYRALHRNQAISWFERSTDPCLLSNAKLLAVGVDSPNIDAIIWNDPRAPAERVVQAVGRALRPSPGKTKATVIVPMIVGPDGNVEKAREHSTFAATIRVLDALRTIDPDFTRTRESLRFYAAKRIADPSTWSLRSDEMTVVAPLEVTDAFADAIEHRRLPPKTRAAPTRRGQEATDGHVRLRPAPEAVPSPSPLPRRSMFEEGLDRLEIGAGDRLLFRLAAPVDKRWLAELRGRHVQGLVREGDLRRIASHLSFLADGLGPAHSELRRTLARYADRSTPEQLVAWLRCRPPNSYAYWLAACARIHDWYLEDFVSRIHVVVTHPGMSAVERARLCLRPLLVAADGLGRVEDPNSRISGVLAAVEDPWENEPPRSDQGWRPDGASDAARADWATYEAGWQAAEQWRAQARLIARLAPHLHEPAIVWAHDRDERRRRSERWDYTTWVVFIDELARTDGDKHRAAGRASVMPYGARVRRVQRLVGADRLALAA